MYMCACYIPVAEMSVGFGVQEIHAIYSVMVISGCLCTKLMCR